MRRVLIGIIGVLIFVIVVIFGFVGFGLFQKYSPGKDYADLKVYYGIGDDSQLGLTINHQVVYGRAVDQNGTVYLDYDTVVSCLNDRFYYDDQENLLLYTLPLETIRGEEGTDFIKEGDKMLISLNFVARFTDIEYTKYEDPARINLVSDWSEVPVSVLKKESDVREKGGVKSPILGTAKKGDQVVVIEEGDPWTKVATEDGFVGYVKDKDLTDPEILAYSRTFEEPEYTSVHLDGKVRMAWHQVTNSVANTQLSEALGAAQGLNVVAPTWFFPLDTEGNIESLADSDYLAQAHERGLQVWAVVNDFDGESLFGGINSTDQTYELLRRTSTRQTLIQNIVGQLDAYAIDGLNVDFEKISEECGPHYIQFIRELSVECRHRGIILSVDSYVPSDWSFQYHRDEQGIFADYVIIMAYDENGTWSSESGSNSSVPYVEDAIHDSLKVVPVEKLVIALPFYTKVWTETPIPGSNDYEVTCTSVTMVESEEIMNSHGVAPVADPDTGQNIVSFQNEDGSYTRIWMEDEHSLSQKLDMVRSNDLAGVAFWKLTQERPSIWDMIIQYL